MVNLVCLGEALVEFNQQAASDLFRQGFGGDTSNTAIAAARLGVSTRYVTRIGRDLFGDRLRDLWQAEGVATDAVEQDPDAPTGIYFVSHDRQGHHFQYYRAGSAASRMTPGIVAAARLAEARMLHFSAISQAISTTAKETVYTALAAARRAGIQVSYDSNLRLALWPIDQARATIYQTVPQVDLFRPSLDDAQILTGIDDPDGIVDHFLRMGPSTVALTMGKAGVLVATKNHRHRLDGYQIDAIDATGAGDAFNGALLARLILGDDIFVAARFANAAAALSTEGYGAVAPLPKADAVMAFLAQHGPALDDAMPSAV
jgi:2-dehydro-3-deoxygluconokinase